MRFYRVLLHDPHAAPDQPGGVLCIPPNQGSGRIDNPRDYGVLYVGDTPAGCCAEVFYRGATRLKWSAAMLPLRRYPHLVRSLAWYDVRDDALLCDLNDGQALVDWHLRPSDVITRDYAQSQSWARTIFATKRYPGVSWWSFHDGRWNSAGLWNLDVITEYGAEPLTIDHPAFAEAAAVLDVRVVLA